ncbi:MAG: polysaccharide biosynthesis/export family protein [Undibacterium sp.]|nr:polysaccharide biosynthesis/export family protein [Opitutaceae bacterium]
MIVAALAGGYVFLANLRPEPKAQPQVQAEVPPAKKAARYTIRSSDKLSLSVENHGELSTTVRVDSNGAISLRGAPEVRVLGLTIPEAVSAIKAAYLTKYAIGDSSVGITVDGYAPREATIGGQVCKPARYPLEVGATMTLRDLLFISRPAVAGGWGHRNGQVAGGAGHANPTQRIDQN